METIVVHLPLRPNRRAGRKYLIAPNGATTPAGEKNTRLSTMQRALERAFCWRKNIETGQYENLAEFAQRRKLNPDYVSQQISLTLLSPAIIEGILDNTLPRYISLQHLLKVAKEHLWEEQNEKLANHE